MWTPPLPAYEIPTESAAPGQTIIEVIESPALESRFIVTVDVTGLYRVFDEHWNTSWIGDGGEAYWDRSGPVCLAPSMDVAKDWIQSHLRPESESLD